MNVKTQIAKDGTRQGDPIKGSRFFRTFCARCGVPMRVKSSDLEKDHECESCAPQHRGVGNAFSRLNSVDKDLDAYQ